MSRKLSTFVHAEPTSAFANVLTENLHDLRVSHRDLASALGVSVHTIASWTRMDGAKLPSQDNLQRLIYYLERQKAGTGKSLAALASEIAPVAAQTGVAIMTARTLSTTFIGRETLLQDLFATVQRERLVTLVGPGGVGKTRLAVQIASLAVQAFEDGAAVVELAPLVSGSLVPQALAAALHVHEPSGGVLLDAIAHRCAGSQMLLILDNCEHVLASCEHLVTWLLTQCPQIHVLATSREPLGAPSEHVLRIPALNLPSHDDLSLTRASLLRSDAARLFVERAMGATGSFALGKAQIPLVAQIVRKLEGMPLAIELAAACARSMSLVEIATRLDDRFRLLVGSSGDQTHHRTLRATMDWSYNLLSPPQCAVFMQLAVFRGGWTEQGAAAVCDLSRALTRDGLGDLLRQLVDKSLVTAESDAGDARFRMQESVREYALEKLRLSACEFEMNKRHAAWCLALAENSASALTGRAQLEWLDRMDAERANIRAALAWALDTDRDVSLSLALAGFLRPYWLRRAQYREGFDYAGRAIDLALKKASATTSTSMSALSAAQLCAGMTAFYQARYRIAKAHLSEALAISKAAGNRYDQAHALNALAQVAMYHDEYERAASQARAAHALFEELRDVWGAATAQVTLGYAIGRMPWSGGHAAEMRIAFEHAMQGFSESGDRFGMGAALNGLGGVELHVERYDQAGAYYQQSLDIHRALDDQEWVSRVLNNLAECRRGLGDAPGAVAICERALAIRLRLGALFGIATLRHNLGMAYAQMQDYPRALEHLRESMRLNVDYGDVFGVAQAAAGIAGIWLERGVRTTDSARLLSFAAAHLGHPGAAFTGPDRTAFERHLALAHRAMSAAELDAAMQDGRALDVAAVGSTILALASIPGA